jgi:hypothetical protein
MHSRVLYFNKLMMLSSFEKPVKLKILLGEALGCGTRIAKRRLKVFE